MEQKDVTTLNRWMSRQWTKICHDCEQKDDKSILWVNNYCPSTKAWASTRMRMTIQRNESKKFIKSSDGSVRLTFSFQDTDVTESVSHDKSHNLVTWNEKSKFYIYCKKKLHFIQPAQFELRNKLSKQMNGHRRRQSTKSGWTGQAC